MKLTAIRLLVVFLSFWVLMTGCGSGDSVNKEELVALKRAHDTRLVGLCRRGDKFFEKSFHMSEKIPCGEATVDAEKYLKYKEYEPLPGKEVEFQHYLRKSKK